MLELQSDVRNKRNSGSAIRLLREYRGIKQESISDSCPEISRTMLSRIETGQIRIKPAQLGELASALKCSKRFLLLAQPTKDDDDDLAWLLLNNNIEQGSLIKNLLSKYSDYSDVCQARREKLGITKHEITKRTGMKLVTVTRVEIGGGSLADYMAICEAMGESLAQLVVEDIIKRYGLEEGDDEVLVDVVSDRLGGRTKFVPDPAYPGSGQIVGIPSRAPQAADTAARSKVIMQDVTMERAHAPSIPRGAVVSFDQVPTHAGRELSGKVAVIQQGNDEPLLIRELVDAGSKWQLLAWNERFPVVELQKDQCEIIGVVREFTVTL